MWSQSHLLSVEYISANIDGSQDSEIGCIKDGGIAAEAAGTIAEKTQELTTVGRPETQDPFADLDEDSEPAEDEDELEENETVVQDS